MADANVSQITPQSAERIARAVQAVEAMTASNAAAKPNTFHEVSFACAVNSPTALAQGNLTPDTATWSRDVSGSGGPFSMKFITSVNWDSSGGVLSYNYRTITFDGCGKAVTVSAETKVTVDTATSCS